MPKTLLAFQEALCETDRYHFMGEDSRASKVQHAPEGLPSHHLLIHNSDPSFLTLESAVLTT